MNGGRLDRRLAALGTAVDLAEGRLDGEPVEAARAVVQRAGKRLGLGLEATVVALAGPTGAGKSSLFNALAEDELAATGRRRPTTSASSAAVWGQVGGDLLDWLEVPRRHHLGNGKLEGLVLLDLPDFDSVEIDHRLEVERVIELVDLLVWVVDPQKYADAALHERYLRQLTEYGKAMVVVINQADVLTPDALEACRRDLRRLLDEDGIADVPVLAVSARAGDGVPGLQKVLAERVARREAAIARLSADVQTAATALRGSCGDGSVGKLPRGDREQLLAALEVAAGVPTVTRAVAQAHRRRGALAAGWPFVRWLRRLRPDPLRRLRLGDRAQPDVRTSLPGPSPVQRSQVASSIRMVAAGIAGELPAPWPGLARSAATAREDELADRLDRAVAAADLHMTRPRWWTLAGLLQKLLAAAVLVGVLWLLALAVLGYLQLGEIVPTPELDGWAVPTLLLLGGTAAGILLALLFRFVNGAGARRRARAATRSLGRRIEEVAEELVVAPLEAELGAYEQFCAELGVALGGRRRG